VLSWRRRWYVVGLDRDRGEARSFRLSRITGEVQQFGKPGEFERPADIDMVAYVAQRPPDQAEVARIKVSEHGAGQLRRIASKHDGDVLTITYSDLSWLARVVASTGLAAQVLEPPELIAEVSRRLRAVVTP
jgi:proteasome accessory factor B